MKPFIAFLMLAILTSCSMDKQYFLRTDDAEGITEGAIVYRQGIEVGEVSEVSFDGNDVLIEIEINEPLYEDQGFDLERGPDGKPSVDLDRPDKDANELSPGATIENRGFGGLFGEHLGGSLEKTLTEGGKEIDASIEELFGRNGEKLERKFKDIFGENGEKLERSIEKLIGKDGEKLQESLENIIGKDGEKLKEAFEEFGDEFKEIGDEIKDLERRYGKDTPEFEAAVKKALREWAESN